MERKSGSEGAFAGTEYLSALCRYYPEIVRGTAGSTLADFGMRFAGVFLEQIDQLGADWPERFVPLARRPVTCIASASALSKLSNDPRTLPARASYKGLLNLKSPFDLVLYSSLIWELQPRTILEFGAAQGGSSLWLADQLETMVGYGEVHSFEMLTRCIHPRASHPRLVFHEVDLRNLDSLDAGLLERLPHPWLVIDDAHANLERLVPFLLRFMTRGDYYVIEDVYFQLVAGQLAALVALADAHHLVVDTKYTDAFGLNVTASPNFWLKLADPG